MTNTKNSARFKTRDLVLIAMFASLMAICAWLTIPAPIPFTMQVFAVFAALCILGGRRGLMAVLLYLLLGAVGLPVFSGFNAGLGVLVGTTGGYLVGFIFSSLVYWGITAAFPRGGVAVKAAALLCGLVACYAFGTAWFMIAYMRQQNVIGVGAVLMRCVVPYIIPDLLKLALAIGIGEAVTKRVGEI